MNAKKNRSKAWLWGLVVLLVAVPLTILLVKRLEGRPPVVTLDMQTPAIGAERSLTLQVADDQNGLREVRVAIVKDGKETVLLEKSFPSRSMLVGGFIRRETLSVPVEPKARGLSDGKAVLTVVARDYAWRRWGAGNHAYQQYEVLIDTRAPGVNVLSLPLNLNQGGAGVVVYKLSEDCPVSGVNVGDDFYPGYAGDFKDPLTRLAMIALSYEQGVSTRLSVTATDFAGNKAIIGLPNHINGKKFKQDQITISDNFLNAKMPEFLSQVPAAPGAPLIDVFLMVNRDLRRQNYETLVKYTGKPDTQIHWEGVFLRLPSAANRAGYADHRKYNFQGKVIDEQNHMGIDLASLEQSPVPAANNGKVVMADTVGIYGGTVMLDHGFGLFSMYSHLSAMDVAVGQMVSKGDIIGKTGMTGLAGGDHLHYAMLVHQTFINPIEWWDAQWIQNNILSKVTSIQQNS